MARPDLIHQRIADLREAGWQRLYPAEALRVTVGSSTCGKACGADDILKAVRDFGQTSHEAIEAHEVGCDGWCWSEPIMEVQLPGGPRAVYGKIEPGDVGKVLEGCLEIKIPRRKLLGIVYRDRLELLDSWVELAACGEANIEETSFLSKQEKRVTSAWGHIVPWSIEEYAAIGGYSALAKVLDSNDPEGLIAQIEESGIRGRGGAGFSMGRKWRATREAQSSEKYLIANADEGDPGAYMDRGLMESDPHQLVEGMIIAGFAIGASKGYVFTRSEYPLAIKILRETLDEAREANVLGEDILGSGFSFDIEIICSAGAYVCGEATAMANAMEGKRPDPRIRPPRMAQVGLWGKPTCVNNVETLANVPIIVNNGADYFANVGTDASKGTKVFSLAGSVKHAGLIEIPMGMPVKEAVNQIGEIIDSDTRINRETDIEAKIAVQIGGPSGAILPLEMEGLTLDYEGLNSAGGIMGSGGIVVLGRESCVVDIASYFIKFSARESCGRCTACRDGLALCCKIYDKIVAGKAAQEDLDLLAELCAYIRENSLCALGKMATTPVLSSLEYFSDIYQEHLNQMCRSTVCKDLMHFTIEPDKCPASCTSCAPSCPVNAIIGHYGEAFRINQDLCTKCWMCTAQCPYGALRVYPKPYREIQ